MANLHEIDHLHAKAQMRRHVEVEATNDVDAIVDTLLEDGNGALTWVMPTGPGGAPSYLSPNDIVLRIEADRDGVRRAYEELHEIYTLVKVEPIVEISGSFYSFIDTVSYLNMHDSGETMLVPGLALFPSEPDLEGIRGEIMWGRSELDYFTDEPDALPQRRLRNLASHDRLVDAFRAADVTALEKLIVDNALLGVRDHFADDSRVTNINGGEGFLGYYGRVFSAYEINGIDVVERLADEWYVFSELRWTVTGKPGTQHAGVTGVIRTAEFITTTEDSRFRACLGHGTDFIAL